MAIVREKTEVVNKRPRVIERKSQKLLVSTRGGWSEAIEFRACVNCCKFQYKLACGTITKWRAIARDTIREPA